MKRDELLFPRRCWTRAPAPVRCCGKLSLMNCRSTGKRLLYDTLDTANAPADTGVGASRATRTYGNACYDAVIKAKQELFSVAAEMLSAASKRVEDLQRRGGVEDRNTFPLARS